MADFLLLAFIFLLASVAAVPLASRLGLGSVLGYLIAGVLISPILKWLHVDVVAIQHFAEFGVVMMLFLVGLELDPAKLWALRNRLLGLGGLQLACSTALITAAAMLFGQPWSVALTIGLMLSLSSTAIVLQSLKEKGLLRSDGGQASFSVLLFQDIAVIPMLALLPLLALPELNQHSAELAQAAHETTSESHGAGLSWVSDLSAWQAALLQLGAITAIVVGGAALSRPVLGYIAKPGLREMFTAAALFIVIATALLMTLVGLSPALGAFIGGVVLANSEYRHELESDIDPFRGLLLGLFFITVGASINFNLLAEAPGLTVGLTLGLMALKALVLLALAWIFKVKGSDRWLFSLGLAQAGEFGFVLIALTLAEGVIPALVGSQLQLVVALSMFLTPLLFILHERLIAPRSAAAQRPADTIESPQKAIIAGVGRFGGMVNRIVRSAGFQTTVVDYSSEHLDMLRTYGVEAYFGDATNPGLLHAAGIEEADLLVVAIDNHDQINELVKHVVKHHPHVHVLARALDRHHVYELWSLGCRDIIRETYDSSIRAGRSALEALGLSQQQAEKLAADFEQRDRAGMVELAELYDIKKPGHKNPAYVARVKELLEQQEAELRGNTLDAADKPPSG